MIPAMMVDSASRCLAKGFPFALYCGAGEEKFHFVAAPAVVSGSVKELAAGGGFAVSPWNRRGCVLIPPVYDEKTLPEQLPDAPKHFFLPAPTTTAEYCISAEKVREILSAERGKIVLSKVIRLRGSGSPVETAQKYFSRTEGAFRCLYYTPVTGVWVTATPELLCDISSGGSEVRTMSLAGTRRAGCAKAWDSKNREEHDYVTRFIVDTLMKHAEKVEVGASCQVRFGGVEHLCEHVTATGVRDAGALVDELSPTPAVGGTPRERAIKALESLESHERGCYGGWIGARKENGGAALYVNLRCCSAARTAEGWEYDVFAGGGLTADSVTEEEWDEGEQKAALLTGAIRDCDQKVKEA